VRAFSSNLAISFSAASDAAPPLCDKPFGPRVSRRLPARCRLCSRQRVDCKLAHLAGGLRNNLNAALFLPSRRPVGASIPSADLPTDLAFGGSGHADAANSCSTHTASDGRLRHQSFWLMKRRGRHRLRRRCDGQGQGSNTDQPDHRFLLCSVQKIIMPCLAPRNFDSDQHGGTATRCGIAGALRTREAGGCVHRAF